MYPEWFIGGPLHGENKLTGQFAHVQHTVLYIENERTMGEIEWQYSLKKFILGRHVIRCWIDPRMMTDITAQNDIIDFILKPHIMEDKEVSRDRGN